MKRRINGLMAFGAALILGASVFAQQQSRTGNQSQQPSPPQGTGQTMPTDDMMKGCQEHCQNRAKSFDEAMGMMDRAEQSNDPVQIRAAISEARKLLAEMKDHMGMCMNMTNMHGGMNMEGMMQGGGMMSKRQSGGRRSATAVIDPVCNMAVDPKTAPSAVYQGKTYYFCSAEHKAQFERNPHQYVKKQSQ